MHDLVKVAYGCTEIGAIGYPCALAYNQLKNQPIAKLVVEMSPYVFKNASCVGVPGLGMCGCEMIAAAGAYICAPDRKLQIFSSITAAQKSKAKQLVEAKKVEIKIREDVNPVFCKAIVTTTNGNTATATIERAHDNVTLITKNDTEVFKAKPKKSDGPNLNHDGEVFDPDEYRGTDFTIGEMLKIIETLQFEDLTFLEQVFFTNDNIAQYGLKHMTPGSYTDVYNKTHPNPDWKQRIVLNVAAAIDARMRGDSMPVMSSCGSGDHGLTISIPQVTYSRMFKTEETRFLRAMALANMVTWIIKDTIGDLSAFCGSVMAASVATMAGLAYQDEWPLKKICTFIEAMLLGNTCVICDGAKASCTFKVANALMAEFDLFDMVKHGYNVKPRDGIVVGKPVKTIEVIGQISKENSNDVNNTIVKMLNLINQR